MNLPTIGKWIRSNAVLCIAFAAALITTLIVPPDGQYIGYFDFRTLTCLFCVLAVVCALLLLCTMLFAAANWLRQPIYLSPDVVESVGTDQNGWVTVTFSAEAAGMNSFKYDEQWCEDGTVVISVWTYRLHEWRTRGEEPRKITMHYDPDYAVGYFDAENGGNVENLYMPKTIGEGLILLPRLYLSFYFMMALGLGTALVLAAFTLRRKLAGKWLWWLGSFLLCYALCQGFVCEFSFASFYAEQELFWALGMTVCLWGAGACAWSMRKQR